MQVNNEGRTPAIITMIIVGAISIILMFNLILN